MTGIRSRYPFSLLFSGFIQGLIFNAVAGITGILFLVFGFLGSITVLKIVGALTLIFYTIISFVKPIRYLSNISKRITEREYNKITDNVLHFPKGNILSYYDGVIAAIEEKIKPQTEYSEDEYSVNEYINTPPGKSAIDNQNDSYNVEIHPLTLIFGIIFIFGGIYFAFHAISSYTHQLDTKDWRIAMAEVIEVSEREKYESGSAKRSGHYVTVYDITYQYYVNDDSYTGKIIGSYSYRAVGEHFDIKYDPKFSENSTDILEPETDVLIFNLGGSCIFVLIGMWVSGLLPRLLQLIKRHKNSTKAKPHYHMKG